MRYWLRASASVFFVIFAIAAIWFLKIQRPTVSPTGNIVLSLGSSIMIIAGVGLFFLTLFQFVITKELAEEVEKRMKQEREEAQENN
jgi:uncharacterized membrane protein